MRIDIRKSSYLAGRCCLSETIYIRKRWTSINHRSIVCSSINWRELSWRVDDGQMLGVSRRKNIRWHFWPKFLHLSKGLQQTSKKILRHRIVDKCAHPSTALSLVSERTNKAGVRGIPENIYMIHKINVHNERISSQINNYTDFIAQYIPIFSVWDGTDDLSC